MATRTITALYDTRTQAETARQRLLEVGVPDDSIKVEDASRAPADRAHLDALPDEDRQAYEEGIQRGGFLVTVHADGDYDEDAIRVLEETPALDFEERQGQWRASGWTGYQPPQSDQSIGPGASAATPLATESTANDNRTDVASDGLAATGAALQSGTGATRGKKRGGKKAASITAMPESDVGEQPRSIGGASASLPTGAASTAAGGSTVGLDMATPSTAQASQPSALQVPARRAIREDRGSKRVRSYAYEQPTVPAPLPVDQQVTAMPAEEPVPVANNLLLSENALRADATGDRMRREAVESRSTPTMSDERRATQAVGPIAVLLGLIAVAAAAIWAARSRNRRRAQTSPDLYRAAEVEESEQLRPGEIIPHEATYDGGQAPSRDI